MSEKPPENHFSKRPFLFESLDFVFQGVQSFFFHENIFPEFFKLCKSKFENKLKFVFMKFF